MDIGILKNIAQEITSRLLIEADVEVKEIETGAIVSLITKQSGILIGWHGETLSAVQHIIRTLYTSQTGEFGSIVVDVNDYRGRQEKSLQDLALRAAASVKTSGLDQVLRPMSSYERKVVHTALSAFSDVVTESTGEDPYRKIIVKRRILEA